MTKYKDIEINGKKVPEELLKIIMKRIEAMPPGIKLAVLGSILDREKIIEEILKGSDIGKEILDVEIGYYKDLIRS